MCVCICMCMNVQTCTRGYIIFNILYSIEWLENLDRYTDPIPACPPSTAAVSMNMSRPTPPPPKGSPCDPIRKRKRKKSGYMRRFHMLAYNFQFTMSWGLLARVYVPLKNAAWWWINSTKSCGWRKHLSPREGGVHQPLWQRNGDRVSK